MPQTDSDIYSPLPETDVIRLLKLDRKTGGNLSGTLETYSLSEVPDFYALSYVWGTSRDSTWLTVNGKELQITQSLATALSHLSRPEGISASFVSEYIWIDQICINQGDTGERRHQVTLMGPIYTKALRTIIWLGEDEASIAESAFGFCKYIESIHLKEYTTEGNYGMESVPFQMFNQSVVDKYQLPKLGGQQWESLNALFGNRWFGRLWVQQEAILSKEDPCLILGSNSCSFQTVARTYLWLAARDFHYNNIVAREGANIGNLWSIRSLRKLGFDKDLGAMIRTASQSTHATDPRDKVYGLLGVAEGGLERNPATGTRIRVENRPEYTAPQAYRDAARHIMLTTKSLAILSGPKLRTRHISDPYRSLGRQGTWEPSSSWVPSFDFAFHPGTSFVKDTQEDPESPEAKARKRILFTLHWRNDCWASHGLPAEIEHPTSNPDILRVRGIHIDKVRSTQEITTSISTGMQLFGPRTYINRDGQIRHDLDYIRGNTANYGRLPFARFVWQSLYSGVQRPGVVRLWELALEHTSRTPEDLATAVFTVATSGIRWHGGFFSRTELEDFFSYLHHCYKQGGGSGAFSRLRAKGLTDAVEFLQRYPEKRASPTQAGFAALLHLASVDWTNLRRFFLTAEGRLGIGPPAMQSGDSLCVLFGGGVPFVMRRKEGKWLLVGEAFVEGYMHGQVVDEWNQGQREAEWFDIH